MRGREEYATDLMNWLNKARFMVILMVTLHLMHINWCPLQYYSTYSKYLSQVSPSLPSQAYRISLTHHQIIREIKSLELRLVL
jgi:hypothetical protein